MADLPLPLHSYKSDTASSARLVNAFAEATPEGAKGPYVLRRAPGVRPYCACGIGPGRGLHVMAGRLFAVSGAKLYQVSISASEAGTVPGRAMTSMADNGTQLAISANDRLYVYESALTQVSDPDLPSPLGRVQFLDNYLIGIRKDTGQFACSALADFTDWDALDFATAEGAPDNLITLEVDHRAAVLVGAETTEIWENASAGSGFPFTRVPNGFLELGGAAENAIGKQDNSVFWLANDRTFRRLSGATPERVSQHHVEREWRDYSTVSDAYCVPYTLDGHLCMGVNFPTANRSWVLDCTTKEWHERESHSASMWDISGCVAWREKIYVQRASTGEIGVLDPKTYSEWGQALRVEWAYQPIYNSGNGTQVHKLHMGLETGIGLESGQGARPRIMLERSKLGGRPGTFRPISGRSLGEQGKFKTEVHWDGLGSADEHVFRCWLSDPIPLTIWNTVADIEALAA